ncbi:MAG: presqualene diphosphate synthase HpnD [Pseudorhodoplanes sp.]
MTLQTADHAQPAQQRAAGSSFYAAMRILPRAQRAAMFEIYSFCRAVDDLADDEGPRDARRAGLQQWRADIAAIFAGRPPRHLSGLAQAVREFRLRRDDFLAVIDGMEMDVNGDIRAPDAATLDLYCDRVASAVGRLSVRVFGMAEIPGLALAHHLGRALQLTNILRDIDEDAGIGRLYLPREALSEAGIAVSDPQAAIGHPSIGRACAPLVAQAQNHFREADRIMRAAPRATVKAPRIMAEAYQVILRALVARGWSPPRARVRVPRWRFAWIILRRAFP